MNFDTKPGILDARNFGPGGHAISASAGTGKTYTLERLVFDRVVQGDTSIDNILVVTFTRRATAEMKERIRTLFQKCLAEWEQYLETKGKEAPLEGGWTITEKKADRVREALNDFDEATISTIHGFCRELLAEYQVASRSRFDVDFVDRKELFEECFYDVLRDTLAADDTYRSWLKALLKAKYGLETFQKQLQKIYSRQAEIVPGPDYFGLDLEDPRDFETFEKEEGKLEDGDIYTACWHLFLEPVETRIEEKKQLEGLQTYDDLLNTVEAELGDSEAFTRTLRNAYEVVLVDEGQDVDPTQWNILREAFLESPDGYEHELILIGDEKQAIYGFRGADVETYRNARDELEGKTGDSGLDTNYRATAELIEAYDTIFESGFLPEEYDYEGVDAPEGEDRTERNLEGTAIGGDEPEPIEMLHLEGSEDNKISPSEAESAFVEKTAERIDELIGSKEEAEPTYQFAPEDEKERPIEPGDIYVLTRTNSEAEDVGEALRDRGVPFSYFKKPGLFESDEALDVLRLLRAIAQPSDRSRRRKVMLTPFFDLRLDELAAWEQTEDDWSPRERLEQWKELAERRSFPELFEKVLTQSGVVRRRLLSSSDERALTNYHHLFEWLFEHAAGTQLGIEQLADALQQRRQEGAESTGPDEDDADTQRQETDRSTVRISTIHKSKGLESEIVFVCGGFSKRNDENSNRDLKTFREPDEGHAQPVAIHRYLSDEVSNTWKEFEDYTDREIRRLYYVAMTRAKSKLILPYIVPDKEGGVIDWHLNQSEIRYLWDCLEDIDFEENNFETTPFTTDDVDTDPEPPEVIESLDDLEGFDENELDFEDIARLDPPSSPVSGDGRPTFEELRERDQRYNESYSSLTSHRGGRGEPVEEPHDQPLPQGTGTGDVIHEILELVDYETAESCDDWQEWLRTPSGTEEHETVGELIEAKLDEHSLGQPPSGEEEGYKYRPYTAQRLMEALQTPLDTPAGPSLPPLSQFDREQTAREVGFTIPTVYPALVSDELDTSGPERDDYFNGEIDLVVEEDDGTIYLADWKSDSRVGDGQAFDRDTLEAHVQDEYGNQIAVYTAAIVRMLGIENQPEYKDRFGGVFYLFVRGMTDAHEGAGYHIERPSWRDLQHLHDLLATRRPEREMIEDWGEAALER